MIPFANKMSPTITTMIRMDHTHVMAAFHQYSPFKDHKTKQALANIICRGVSIHATLEEEIFYPAIREISPEEPALLKSAPEHDEMRHLIAVLLASSSERSDFDETLLQLMRRVIHHVADEETQLLPLAETRLSHARLCELGAQMTKRRLELMRPHFTETAVNTMRGFSQSRLLWAAGALLAVGAIATRH